MLEIFKRFDLALAPEVAGGAMGMPVGRPEIGGWIRFADGREPDLASLALFADALPPTVLNLDRFGWVPTIELTIHFRAEAVAGLVARLVRIALPDGEPCRGGRGDLGFRREPRSPQQAAGADPAPLLAIPTPPPTTSSTAFSRDIPTL